MTEEKKKDKEELPEPDYEDPMQRKICFYCPVHNGIACLPAYEFTKPTVRCPVCGAELQFMPKDPYLYMQSMMYREVSRMVREIMRRVFGDSW